MSITAKKYYYPLIFVGYYLSLIRCLYIGIFSGNFGYTVHAKAFNFFGNLSSYEYLRSEMFIKNVFLELSPSLMCVCVCVCVLCVYVCVCVCMSLRLHTVQPRTFKFWHNIPYVSKNI